MKCFIIDNYDSFTYNIVQLIRAITCDEPTVRRNDCFSMDEPEAFDGILLSPGPGIPSEAGKLMDVIRRYGPTKSILGICLGHQAIGEAYGAELVQMPATRHGIASSLKWIADDRLRGSLPQCIDAGHYHSWMLSSSGFPDALEVTMEDDAGNVMAIRHRQYNVRGLQFHPESILTPCGADIMANWINNAHE